MSLDFAHGDILSPDVIVLSAIRSYGLVVVQPTEDSVVNISVHPNVTPLHKDMAGPDYVPNSRVIRSQEQCRTIVAVLSSGNLKSAL
jgi:hypothetical protein